MKGWAPKGPLTYKGGGKAANMPTSNPVFNKNVNTTQSSPYNYYKSFEDHEVGKNQEAVTLDMNDLSAVRSALARGDLDKDTQDLFNYVASSGGSGFKPVQLHTGKGGTEFFNPQTSSWKTGSRSDAASEALMNVINRSRSDRKRQKDAVNQPTEFRDPVGHENVHFETSTPGINVMKGDSRARHLDSSGFYENQNKSTNIEGKTAMKPSTRNIEGNKGAKTLSQKRAAAVNKNKLSSYTKAWESNKGGIQQKYKNKAEFVKAAEDWWAKKGLDK